MENKLLQKIEYQVWGGFDPDELELLGSFDNKEDALKSAENCYDFNDLVEIKEVL
jgi:hypothetical protein